MNRFAVRPQTPANRFARRIGLSFLVAAAVGQLYNNIALVRLDTFAVTIPMLLLAAAAAIAFVVPRPRPTDDSTLVMWALLLGWQVFVGLVLGLVTEREWLQSFLLLFFYTTCFAIASRLPIDRDDITWAFYTLVSLVILFGFLGVVQFVLLNFFRIIPALPPEITIVPWTPTIDVYRTGGVLRPVGLSYETSTYSIALSLALVLLMLLVSVSSARNRKLLLIGLLFLLGASLMTLSLAGWAIAVPALLVSALNARFRRFTIPVILIVTAVVIGVFHAGLITVVSERLENILAGNDASANVRVLAALVLLVHPTNDVAHFFTGYGLGQNPAFLNLMDEVYFQKFAIAQTNIHNIFTIVRVTQGWVGILLHVVLLLVIVRPGSQRNRSLYLPMFIMILALHFASGYYLDPAFWAILTLIAVLRSVDADQPAGRSVLRPAIWSGGKSAPRLSFLERR